MGWIMGEPAVRGDPTFRLGETAFLPGGGGIYFRLGETVFLPGGGWIYFRHGWFMDGD